MNLGEIKNPLALSLLFLLGGCSLSAKIDRKSSQLQVYPPKINSLSPPAASTVGGATLTISGSGFQSNTIVTIGSSPCLNTKVLTSTQIRCVLPAQNPGSAPIVVSTPGVGEASSDYWFQSDLFTQVDFLAGSYTAAGAVDGAGKTARFQFIRGMASDGVYLYVTIGAGLSAVAHHIRRVHIQSGQVETWAGDPLDVDGGTGDGPVASAQFIYPDGIVRIGRKLYVADSQAHTIRRVDLDAGIVSTFAGQPLTAGTTDGSAQTTALFDGPGAMATDGNSLFVADETSYTIRKIDLTTQQVTTLTGTAGMRGMVDGPAGTSRIYAPHALAFASGRLYLSDQHCIREIDTVSGEINSFAGKCADDFSGSAFADGIGPSARFTLPEGLTSDGDHLYVTDLPANFAAPHLIRKIRVDTGAVTTIAGNPTVSVPGTNDGPIGVALFSFPQVIHFDPQAGIFVTSGIASPFATPVAIRRIH